MIDSRNGHRPLRGSLMRVRYCRALLLTALASPASLLGAQAPAPRRTILAIGAHAGDMELTTGSVLLAASERGDRVVLLHLTLGEGGNPRRSPAAYGAQKRREALAKGEAVAFAVEPGSQRRVLDSLP